MQQISEVWSTSSTSYLNLSKAEKLFITWTGLMHITMRLSGSSAFFDILKDQFTPGISYIVFWNNLGYTQKISMIHIHISYSKMVDQFLSTSDCYAYLLQVIYKEHEWPIQREMS